MAVQIDRDTRFCFGEVLPQERLNESLRTSLFRKPDGWLGKMGFEKIYGSSDVVLARLVAPPQAAQIAGKRIPPESRWLLSVYATHLFVKSSDENLFFGFLSDKPGSTLTPFSGPVQNLVQWVGGDANVPPCLCREIIGFALESDGRPELAAGLCLKSSFPPETALTIDISLTDDPLACDMRLRIPPAFQVNPILYVSNTAQNASALLDAIQCENDVSKLVLAQGRLWALSEFVPMSWNVADLFHHYEMACRTGELVNLVDQVLAVAVSLQWRWGNDRKPLADEEVARLASAQFNRVKRHLDSHNATCKSIQILQKRFPGNALLLELEASNQWSALCLYSPVYRRWRHDLRRFLEERSPLKSAPPPPLSGINWSELANHHIASEQDARSLMALVDVDPSVTLVKMRVILEKVVNVVYERYFHKEDAIFADQLYKLNEKRVFPPLIYVFLNALRLAGNIGAHSHSSDGTKQEVEALLPVFVCVIDWFVDRIARGPLFKS